MSELMGKLRWGIIGFGEAGSVLAKHISRRLGRAVYITDPALSRNPVPTHLQQRLDDVRPRVQHELCELVRMCDIVLSLVTPRAACAVADKAARSGSRAIFVDLNSISAKEKIALSRLFAPGLYVDGAILGSIASEGASTRLVLSGESAKRVTVQFRSVGLKVSRVGIQVGAASALKMCRSLFMKGIECLLVETLLSAAEFDICEPVIGSIEETVNSYGFRRMVEMLVTTHAVHCGRRSDEMRSVKEMLNEIGVSHRMCRATEAFLRQSFRSGLSDHFRSVLPESSKTVIDYLRSNHRQTI